MPEPARDAIPEPVRATVPAGPARVPAVPAADAEVLATLLEAREGLEIEARSQFRMAAERFIHHRVALFGLGVFIALVLFGTIGPFFWHYSYSTIISSQNFTGATGPTAQNPFGTDTIGHDLFAQVMRAEATSVKTAMLVAALSTVIGTVIGALAGYYGKWADSLLMRFTDLVLVFPLLAILLVLANKLSKFASSWLWIAVILAALLWTYLARLVRGAFLSLREREFVEAAHAIGASDGRIIFRHMVPNAVGSIVVNATLTVANAILIEAFLSFLGLGIQPPEVSLGNLVAQGQSDATVMPWLFFFPAGFLIVTILAVNFIGDGLRDALDPAQRVRS
jgi:ABC-type dipeptide/oligopeptide/nickel transport system permease subunit